MSGILKSFFDSEKQKNLDNNACKYLTSYNNNLRLFNYGLLLSENNILKIKKYTPNATNKTKNKDNKIYCHTESNPFNTNHFYPKKNNNSFYEEIIFSNCIKNKKNKTLKPINNIFPEVSINKEASMTSHNYNKTKLSNCLNLSKKKKFNKYNKITVINYDVNEKAPKKETKSLTIKKHRKENSIKVEKIVHSLINNKKIDNNKLHHANSIEYQSLKKNKKNINFPLNKSISPISYIDYNLKINPDNKKFFKSFNKQINCLNDKVEYRKRILKQVDENYRHRFKVEDLKNNYNNNIYTNIDKKKIEEMIDNKDVHGNKFHFNLYDYYNNSHRIKNNNRFKFSQRFGKLVKEIKKNKDLLTFDMKMNNMEKDTEKAVKHLESLSNSNGKMLKNLLDIYTAYEKYDH